MSSRLVGITSQVWGLQKSRFGPNILQNQRGIPAPPALGVTSPNKMTLQSVTDLLADLLAARAGRAAGLQALLEDVRRLDAGLPDAGMNCFRFNRPPRPGQRPESENHHFSIIFV